MQTKRFQAASERSVREFRENDLREETLADRLAAGPLPLPIALLFATEVAASLRELHYDGRAHGWVNPAAVLLDSGHAVLRSGNATRQTSLRADIPAFGALLYEMINGRKAGPDLPLPVVPRTVARTGPEGIRMAANHLASRCLAEDSIDIQNIVTEVRLLKLLAQQLPGGSPASEVQSNPVQLAPNVETPQTAPEAIAEPAVKRELIPDDSKPSGSRCPRCSSAYVYTSKPRTGMEEWLERIGSPVRRCHRCYHRYFVFLGIHFTKASQADNVKTS